MAVSRWEGESKWSPASSPSAEAIDISSTDYTTSTSTRGIYVGGAGNIKVDMEGSGTGITFNGAAAGTYLPLRVKKVYRVGTTATGLVALF